MQVLLILNEKNGNLKLMVRLEKQPIKRRVAMLIEQDRTGEAFRLLRSHAEVISCYPRGAQLPLMPQVTLVEEGRP